MKAVPSNRSVDNANLVSHMPLWMIIPSFHPLIGGEQLQLRELSKAHIAQGWHLQVLTRRNTSGHLDGLSGRDVVEGIPVTRVYSRGVGKLGSILFLLGSLWHLLRQGRGAIYQAHFQGTEGWVAVIASRLLGGRSILKLGTGRYGYEAYLSSWLARWQFTRLLRLAHKIVVVNREVERLLIELGASAWQVVLIPNGVDTNYFFPPSPEKRVTSRRLIMVEGYSTIVLFVGRLVSDKGLDILPHAWAELPADVRAATLLVLVGDGEDRKCCWA